MNEYSIEKKFLSLGLVFGLLFIFLIPPLQAPDEDSHFKKSYLISSLHLFPQASPNGLVGNYIPQAIMDFENKLLYLKGNMDERYSYKEQYIDSHTKVNKGNDIFIEYSTSRSNPILFIPQAFGMFLLKVTIDNPIISSNEDISPINYIYAGRIFNLLFFLFSSYYALKIIPFLKNTLFLLCLMPMTLSLASSLSYDAVIISCILLFISVVFKLTYNKNVLTIDRKYLYYLIIFSMILIQFKQVYYPLLFLFLLIPNSKFKNKKEKYFWFLTAFFIGVLSFLIWSLFTKMLLGVGSVSTDTNAVDQLKFILSSPIEYMQILIRTMFVNMKFYLVGFIGNLGWLDTNFPYIFIIAYSILLLITVLFDNSKIDVRVKLKEKGMVAAIAISIIVLMETALYITWTSKSEVGGIGYEIVSGVQGRYFIPIAILFLSLFIVNSTKYREKIINATTILTFLIPKLTVFSLAYTTIILLLRYWIPSP